MILAAGVITFSFVFEEQLVAQIFNTSVQKTWVQGID